MKPIRQAAINYVNGIGPGVFRSVSVDRMVLDSTNFHDKSAIIMVHVVVNKGMKDVFRVWVEIEADIEFTNLRVVR